MVVHVVLRCALFSDQRHMCFSPPYTLKNVLGEDCDKKGLIKFLRENNISKKVVMHNTYVLILYFKSIIFMLRFFI